MSYLSINHCVNNVDLQQRVTAAVMKEALANEELGGTPYGRNIKINPPTGAVWFFMWPVAIANEDDYAYAFETNNVNAGKDPGVISDAEIQAAIQVNWPATLAASPSF